MKTEDKSSPKKSFQSYLLITQEDTQTAVTTFLKTLNITLAQNSPDFTIINPEKDTLSIEEAREIKKLIFQKPIQSRHKILVIPNAHNLSFVVQNSLLKTLEEPPQHAIIILVAKSTKNILPTVLSRTVIITSQSNKLNQNNDGKYSLSTIEELAQIEDPKTWVDLFLISQYRDLLKAPAAAEAIHIRKSIELAQETKSMIEANVNPKFALMGLWIKAK